MLKRAIAGVAVIGLCVAGTTQLDHGHADVSGKDLTTQQTAGADRSAGAAELTTTRLATGLTRPVQVTHDGVNPDWIYVLEQRSGSTGRIKILNRETGSVISTFLSISGLNTSSEQGLLGLAFHPNYETNGYFFVNFTRSNRTYISRYSRSSSNPAFADSSSEEVVMFISQPYTNHNGGWIDFGPDGYLYISNGDGGSAGDPGNRSQNLSNLLGKMLRIDVDSLPYTIPADNPFASGGGEPEIWSYGLRNAWRCSFDRDTGDLYMGDVGQNAWEEISYQPASSPGGENYGWRCYEGDQSYNTSGCPSSGTMTFPIWDYSHGGSPFRCSVTGGYVYRGAAIPSLSGTYFFADYCSNNIWTFRYTQAGGVTEYTDRTSELTPNAGAIGAISSFGEDYYGELYICDLNGEVFKLIPDSPVGACCFNEQCIGSTQAQCDTVGGEYLGDGFPCDDEICLNAPDNDECATAISVVTGPNDYNTENATASSVTESCEFGDDVWFKFQPMDSGTMLVTTTGVVFNPEVGLYGECPSGNFEAILCGETSFIYSVTEGSTYHFRIGSASGAQGYGQITISVIPDEEECVGDCDGNGTRDVNDLLALLADFGNPSDCDLNDDGVISVDDILTLLANYGVPCE
ncbi:MAG: PQQ-dependent sugar dehydrogenase [Phycisphaerales bacterium]|nr:PQQ-dependent sugar dehydrogenase [Phycisphaerales bacterium]